MGAGRVAVGVDLGASNARAGLVEVDSGSVLADLRASIGSRAPEDVADLVRDLVQTIDPGRRAVGIGVGVAGMLRGETGIVENAPNFGWRAVDLRGLLRARLGPAVELYNDVNAIAFGEHRHGAGKGARDVLYVFIGTGLGAGLVLGGRLYIGAAHLAGELGHVKVVPGGRLCGCGQRGCLEAYVSGAHIAKRAREDLDRGARPAANRAGGIDALHAGHVDEAARAGDRWAVALWEEIAPLLGLALANAVTLLNPERVVIGGSVWWGCEDLARRARSSCAALVNAPSGAAATLVDATPWNDTFGIAGAATLVAEHYPFAAGP